jgi:hypothetical protein
MTATSTARRWLAAGLLALGAATLAAAPPPRRATDPPKAPSISRSRTPVKARYQGAPGTASQYLAMGLTVGGVAMIALLIVRDSRRRARRDAAEADTRDA